MVSLENVIKGVLRPTTVYAIAILLIGVISIYPLNLPIVVSDQTKKAFDLINALPSGSIIAVSNEGLNWDQYVVIKTVLTKHLLSKGIKWVDINFADSNKMVDCELVYKQYVFVGGAFANKKYGEDYAMFTFVPGLDAAIAVWVKDFRSVYKVDYYGTPTDNLPIMKNINVIEDFVMVVVITLSAPWSIVPWMRVEGGKYLKFIFMVSGVNQADVLPFIQIGQIQAMVVDVRGGAEYEKLSGFPGLGAQGTDSMSVYVILIVVLVGISNISLLQKRFRKEAVAKV